MNKTILILLVVSVLLLFVPLPSPGAVNEYMDASGTTPVKVASSTPLPVALTGASGTVKITSDGQLDVRIASSTITILSSGTSTLAAGTNTVGSIGAIINALPAGTNLLGKVNINSVNGYAASLTATVGSSVAVICPTLPTSTKKIYITTDQRINMGGSDIGIATAGLNFIPANAPASEFAVGTTTPAIYFRAQSATATVSIVPGQEP